MSKVLLTLLAFTVLLWSIANAPGWSLDSADSVGPTPAVSAPTHANSSDSRQSMSSADTSSAGSPLPNEVAAELDTADLLAGISAHDDPADTSAPFASDYSSLLADSSQPDGSQAVDDWSEGDSYSYTTWSSALELAGRAKSSEGKNSPGNQAGSPAPAPSAIDTGDSSANASKPADPAPTLPGDWSEIPTAPLPIETLPIEVLTPDSKPVSAPEPSSLGLLGLGVLGTFMARRRRTNGRVDG